jgi:membrane protein implicated in regulation of membrane protease activity
VDPWVLWLIAAGLFAAGEVASLDLVLLMFAGGSVGGLGVALLGGPVALQLLAFVLVSLALLAVVRPIATRHLSASTPQTAIGVAAVVGRTAKVTRPVDLHGGRIRLDADEWSARTQHGGETFDVGETVRILEVHGATAVVGEAFE